MLRVLAACNILSLNAAFLHNDVPVVPIMILIAGETSGETLSRLDGKPEERRHVRPRAGRIS